MLRDQFKEKIEKVKDEIDKLRRERRLFKEGYAKLEEDLEKNINTNLELQSQIDQNTTIYQLKSNEMYEIQTSSQQKQQQFMEEMKQLKQLQDKTNQEDQKLEENLNVSFRTTKFTKLNSENFDTATVLKQRLQKIIV